MDAIDCRELYWERVWETVDAERNDTDELTDFDLELIDIDLESLDIMLIEL